MVAPLVSYYVKRQPCDELLASAQPKAKPGVTAGRLTLLLGLLIVIVLLTIDYRREIRNPNIEILNKFETSNVQMLKTGCFKNVILSYLDLFRV